MIDKEKIESLILGEGFKDYKWINPKEIIVAHWVRAKCFFGCSEFGSGTCPPNTPSVEDCKAFFNEYESGLVFRLSKFADKNAYPSEWSKEMTNKLLNIEREVFLLGFHKVFLLNHTCCSICKDCSRYRIDCKDKAKSRPSPESFAVDVYNTLRKAGLEINVVAENPAEMNRIAILLVE